MPASTIQLNQAAPDWVLPNPDGHPYRLSELGGSQGVLVFFMRGFWCPICTRQMQELRQHAAQLSERGIQPVVIMTDDPVRVAGSLYANPAPFPVLIDAERMVVQQYGLRDRFAFLPTKWTDVPRPSCFLLDHAGIVRFMYVGNSPNDRPPMSTIMAVIDQSTTVGLAKV